MNPIIKWPGGKAGEIKRIEKLIPKDYGRYVEPFFGGGALFFHLDPQSAAINDISADLMDFYRLIKAQDEILKELLTCISDSFAGMTELLGDSSAVLLDIYHSLKNGEILFCDLPGALAPVIEMLAEGFDRRFEEMLLLSREAFYTQLEISASDKFRRTVINEAKKPFSEKDLTENLITGFTGGFYMYFRSVFNDIALNRAQIPEHMHPEQYRSAVFYFVREYCYGSMFRYNVKGEFNIPYGGMSYNKKNMRSKLISMFSEETRRIFENTEIHCEDFELFIKGLGLTESDFMFLDPPYDTDFSDYEGKAFTRRDQMRLAMTLWDTKARFILIIKNTDFIYQLYAGNKAFRIFEFDKQYTYNVRGRNKRGTEHLIVTNLPAD